MRVLVGCEESQEVCKAFRALGHEAFITKWDKAIFFPECRHLVPTDITFRREPAVHNMWPTKYKNERSKLRAKTDPKVAAAMAEQWGGKIN